MNAANSVSQDTGRRATVEIVGYHVVGYEDDHFSGLDRGYLPLVEIVRQAGGESVCWEVLEAHRREAEGIELSVFAEYLATPLPAPKRYRLTLEILPVGGVEQ